MWEECKPVEIRHVKNQWIQTGLTRFLGADFFIFIVYLTCKFDSLEWRNKPSDCVAVAAAAVAWSDWSASVAPYQQKPGCETLPPLGVASA